METTTARVSRSETSLQFLLDKPTYLILFISSIARFQAAIPAPCPPFPPFHSYPPLYYSPTCPVFTAVPGRVMSPPHAPKYGAITTPQALTKSARNDGSVSTNVRLVCALQCGRRRRAFYYVGAWPRMS